MLEVFTEKARQTVSFAKYEAAQFGSVEVETEHILLGLLRDPVLANNVLRGVSVEGIRAEILAHRPSQQNLSGAVDLPLSAESLQALVFAGEEAKRLSHRSVSNEHIVLGLLRVEGCYATQLLQRRQLSTDGLRSEMERVSSERAQGKEDSQGPSTSRSDESTPALGPLMLRVAALSQSGEHRRALKLLDEFLAEPCADQCSRLRTLFPVATSTARAVGDLDSVRHYCEQLLACYPEDPLAVFGFADCLELEGQTGEAKRYALRSYELSLAKGGVEGQGLIELIEKRFPTIKAKS